MECANIAGMVFWNKLVRLNKKRKITKKLARNLKIIQMYLSMIFQTKLSMIDKEIILNVKSAIGLQSIIKN